MEWFNTNSFFTGELEQNLGVVEIEKGIGTQWVLNTPIDGLRVIFGGQIGKVNGGISFSKDGGPLGPQVFYDGFVSIDADFENFFFRSEYLHMQMDKSDVNANVGYAQAGYYLSESFSVNVQVDYFNIDYVKLPPILVLQTGKTSFNLDFNQDYSAGVKYNFSSNYTIKVEGHFNRGYQVEDIYINHFKEKPLEILYSIISLSTSF